MGGGGLFGGGGEAPKVEPIPEKQPTKSLSAGASAAAQAQKDKQRKNRGLASSIMTTRGALSTTDTGKEKTLG